MIKFTGCPKSAEKQSNIIILRPWFPQNFMIMSPKTKYVIFSPRRNIVFSFPLKYHTIACSDDNNCMCPSIEQASEIK